MKLFLSLFITTAFIAAPAYAVTFNPTDGGQDTTGLLTGSNLEDIQLGDERPTAVALNLINAALSLLAAVCIGLLVYAGFLWVWARGNQEEVTKAKNIIQGTVIGLVVVLAALGITQFVFTTVGDITGATVTTS